MKLRRNKSAKKKYEMEKYSRVDMRKQRKLENLFNVIEKIGGIKIESN